MFVSRTQPNRQLSPLTVVLAIWGPIRHLERNSQVSFILSGGWVIPFHYLVFGPELAITGTPFWVPFSLERPFSMVSSIFNKRFFWQDFGV